MSLRYRSHPLCHTLPSLRNGGRGDRRERSTKSSPPRRHEDARCGKGAGVAKKPSKKKASTSVPPVPSGSRGMSTSAAGASSEPPKRTYAEPGAKKRSVKVRGPPAKQAQGKGKGKAVIEEDEADENDENEAAEARRRRRPRRGSEGLSSSSPKSSTSRQRSRTRPAGGSARSVRLPFCLHFLAFARAFWSRRLCLACRLLTLEKSANADSRTFVRHVRS